MEKYTRKAVDSTRIFTTHMTVNDLKRAVTKASLDSETRPRMKDVKSKTIAFFIRTCKFTLQRNNRRNVFTTVTSQLQVW